MKQLKYILIVNIINFLLIAGVVLFGPYFPKPSDNTIVIPTISQAITNTPPISVSPEAVKVGCIITINGRKYDVTVFREQHSGGNIFKCGTDMSTTFFKQHDQKLLEERMSQFAI